MTRAISFDPGYRNLGIAICEEGRLLYAYTLTVGSPHAPLKMGKTAVDFIDDLRITYGPFDVVTFETPPFVKNMKVSCLIWHVMGAITGWAATHGYPIWNIAPITLKKVCCNVMGHAWHNKFQPKKSEIALAVLRSYPYIDTDHAAPRSDHADDAALVAYAYFKRHAFGA
mgnify:FL=1